MRLRLMLSFVLVMLVSIASVVIATRYTAANEVRNFMYGGGMARLDSITQDLQDYYRTHHTWQGASTLLTVPGHGQGAGPGGMMGQGAMGMMGNLQLADADGRLVADTANANPSGTLSASELKNAITLKVDGKTVGYLLPQPAAGFTAGDETALVNRLNRGALIAGLLAGGFSLLLALLLAQRLLRPVQDLTQAAHAMAQGDLSQRVTAGGDGELATLGEAFNHMASSLQQAEESRRAITADIAHELRNPLAVQRATLEALQDGVYPLTPDNLAPILEQNQLLTRLVEDLRTLALAETGQLNLECLPTDYPVLIRGVMARFLPQAAAQQVKLNFTADGSGDFPILQVDPTRVEQIVSNLISNALRHTPAGGEINLRLDLQAGSARLRVQDTGPGIPDGSLERIFERFYRIDRSRSRSEGGTGLGLAIARQLAEAHQGSLKAANQPQGGAEFTLSIPLQLAA